MKDSSLQQQQQQQGSTRTSLRKTVVGEIVEVQGGHIVRATGLKDRHSKVCTAKGPRDRRVRLSANTAIQFYDVQDRLGYDRPSKAVDWLIKKAKASIDELQQLPAWSPSSMNVWTSTRRRGGKSSGGELQDEKGNGNGGGMDGCEEHQLYNDGSNSSSSLLPPSLDSDAIADTIKSFFPMGGGNAGPATTGSVSESPMHFQDYQQLRRGGGGGGDGDGGYGDGSFRKSQDLKLSLQSFEDPVLMHHSHSHHHGGRAAHDEQQLSLIPGAVPIGLENLSTGWADSEYEPSLELGQLHRLVVGWNTQHSGTKHHDVGANSGSNSDGGFVFNQPSPQLQPLFGGGQHSQYFTQRGPLQSSNTPSIRAWISDPSFSIASPSEQHSQYHPQALSGLGFTSGGLSGFHIPARIQGEEEHDGDLNRQSSASSGSHH